MPSRVSLPPGLPKPVYDTASNMLKYITPKTAPTPRDGENGDQPNLPNSPSVHIDRRFNNLSRQLQTCESHLADVLRQMQDQLRSLETSHHQIMEKLAQAPVQLDCTGYQKDPGGGEVDNFEVVRVTSGQADSQLSVKFNDPGTTSYPEAVPLLSDREDDGVGGAEEAKHFEERLAEARRALQEGKVKQSPCAKAITDFLEDSDSSPAARFYQDFMTLFNLCAIVLALMETLDVRLPRPWDERVAIVIDALLVLEIVVRLMFCPNFRSAMTNPQNMIDACSVIPLTMLLTKDHVDHELELMLDDFLLVSVPVIRLLRMVRRFPHMQLLISAFKTCLEALPVLLYTMAVMGIVFTSLIFLVEPRDNISTMAESAWLVLSTMTTVGYGDVTPSTQSGTLLASLLMIISSLYMAMPVAIIGYQFTVIWGNRAQILLLHSTRDRLAKWGFGAYEIPRLFQLFDLDDSDEIDIEEFKQLMQQMEIGFREDDIVELFKTIDKDSGGSIDTKEFIKTLYPEEYRHMFGKKKDAEGGGGGGSRKSMHMSSEMQQ